LVNSKKNVNQADYQIKKRYRQVQDHPFGSDLAGIYLENLKIKIKLQFRKYLRYNFQHLQLFFRMFNLLEMFALLSMSALFGMFTLFRIFVLFGMFALFGMFTFLNHGRRIFRF